MKLNRECIKCQVNRSQSSRLQTDVLSKIPSLNESLENSLELSPNQKIMSEKWLVLSIIKEDLLRSIKLFCVFGVSGNEAVIVSKDDKVWALGSNTCSCLGLGDGNPCLEPRKVEELSGKKIVSFAYGSGPHLLILTESGEVWGTGHNGYYQLGNGSTNQVSKPIHLNTNLAGKKVKALACGSHHSLALTSEGGVYSWGQNNCGQVGSGSTANQATPRKVTCGIGIHRAIDIACGQNSSFAVCKDGELYSWGYNGNGQLGIGTNTNQPNPVRVSALQGVVIKKVVSGYAHTMALTDEGSIYSWGANSYGQLGNGNKNNLVLPNKVEHECFGRILDIAASHYNHVSAVINQQGKVFMWGQIRSISVINPVLVPLNSLQDVFACFSCPAVTSVPVRFDPSPANRILDDLRTAFNDEVSSDVKFMIEGKPIFAHKAILKIRCEHFRSMFQGNWEESDQENVEMDGYSYQVYYAFIKYLYTDQVEIQAEEAVGLLDLANAYCEEDLKKKCEKLIREGISVENVATLMSAAIKYNASDLEDFCFRFSLLHLTNVVQSPAFEALDPSDLKNFIQKAASSGAFKH